MPHLKCSSIFTLTPSFFKSGRAATKDMKEHGGNTYISFSDSTIGEGYTDTGGYNFIEIKRGIVDWHSHPRTCDTPERCAVGVPSHTDLCNIALGALYGTEAHILFSKEGTYVIRLSESTKQQLQNGKIDYNDFKVKIDRTLIAIHKSFANTRDAYRVYRQKYIKHVRLLGFVVSFFRGNAPPTVRLFLSCNPKHNIDGIKKVFVPGNSVNTTNDV